MQEKEYHLRGNEKAKPHAKTHESTKTAQNGHIMSRAKCSSLVTPIQETRVSAFAETLVFCLHETEK